MIYWSSHLNPNTRGMGSLEAIISHVLTHQEEHPGLRSQPPAAVSVHPNVNEGLSPSDGNLLWLPRKLELGPDSCIPL